VIIDVKTVIFWLSLLLETCGTPPTLFTVLFAAN